MLQQLEIIHKRIITNFSIICKMKTRCMYIYDTNDILKTTHTFVQILKYYHDLSFLLKANKVHNDLNKSWLTNGNKKSSATLKFLYQF